MKLAVIIFPGPGCDADLLWVAEEVMGIDAEFAQHNATSLAEFDDVLLPDGSFHNDYPCCGAIARFSPTINGAVRFATEGKMVSGIRDGFQILTEIGLLPDTLLRNDPLRLICKDVSLKASTRTKFISEYSENISTHSPVAHGEGNYCCDEKTSKELKEKSQIVFTYQEEANSSLANIVGICSEQDNVLGMMPHPEQAMGELLGSTDERSFSASTIKSSGEGLSQW